MKNFKMMISGFVTIFLLSMMPAMVLAMTLSQGADASSSTPSGGFSHNDSFSLGEAFDAQSGSTNPSVATVGGTPGRGGDSSISGLESSLFEAGDSTLLGSQRTAGSDSTISAQLPAGDYRFNVQGDSGGRYAGSLNLSASSFVTPVPEVSTWIMMIFGLGFIAFLLKNKNGASRKKLTVGAALAA